MSFRFAGVAPYDLQIDTILDDYTNTPRLEDNVHDANAVAPAAWPEQVDVNSTWVGHHNGQFLNILGDWEDPLEAIWLSGSGSMVEGSPSDMAGGPDNAHIAVLREQFERQDAVEFERVRGIDCGLELGLESEIDATGELPATHAGPVPDIMAPGLDVGAFTARLAENLDGNEALKYDHARQLPAAQVVLTEEFAQEFAAPGLDLGCMKSNRTDGRDDTEAETGFNFKVKDYTVGAADVQDRGCRHENPGPGQYHDSVIKSGVSAPMLGGDALDELLDREVLDGSASFLTFPGWLADHTITAGRVKKSRKSVKASRREVARAARRKQEAREARLVRLAQTQHITDDELLKLAPKKKRRAARFENPVPSRFCHVCSRTPKNVRLVACCNISKGTCRKVICEKCFAEYQYGDLTAALDTAHSSWCCPHCAGGCPDRAQCRTYQRVNDRLRVDRLKNPGAKRKRSGDGNTTDQPPKRARLQTQSPRSEVRQQHLLSATRIMR